MPEETPQAFISYARVDVRFANLLERSLRYWGSHPWIDRQQLGGGQEWPLALQNALNASQAIVIVITPAALLSSMVRREYSYALSQHIPVLLVRFKKTGPLPPELENLPLVEYRGKPINIATSLYMMLDDRHLISPLPEDRLTMIDPSAIFHFYAQRLSSNERVVRLPFAISRRIIITNSVFLLIVILIALMQQWLISTVGVRFELLILPIFWACLLSIVFLLLPGFMQINMLLGRLPRETMIFMSDRCVVQILNVEHARITMVPQRFLYRFVSHAMVRRGRWGQAIVTLEDGMGGPLGCIVIPRRWPNRMALAQQIVEGVATYQSAQATDTIVGTPASLPPVQAPASLFRPATYCLIAEYAERPLLQIVQRWLARRTIWPDEMNQIMDGSKVIVPTATGAARCQFVLAVITPSLLRIPRARTILADLRRQGKIIIPLRRSPLAVLPDDLEGIQWIDFAKTSDQERSLFDFSDTLYRIGIPLALPNDQFDGELVLARALHQHVPTDWYVARPDTSEQWLYRVYQFRGSLSWLFAAGFAALLVCAMMNEAGLTLATEDHGAAIFAISVASCIVGALYLWWLHWYAPALNQIRFFGRMLHGYYAPECVVITPHGIAYHVISQRGGQFVTGSFTFDQLRAIEPHTGLFGTIKLRLIPQRGRSINVRVQT